ncbi:MAG: hypothetical protein WCP85_04200 [Mariniphaga sp.]
MEPDFSTVLGIIVGTMTMLIIIVIIQRNISAGKKELEEKKSDSPKELEGLKGAIYVTTKDIFELHQYFVINKYQAITAYWVAISVSFLGFILFAIGISPNFFNNQHSINIPTLSGAIVEIIAGLFLWLYRNTTKQMYIFYRSLLDTEKLLIAIQLVENVTAAQKDESYKSIINKILEINVNNSK